MHFYQPDHHHFIIQSFDNTATPAEIREAPAIMLNEHFVYRRTPRISPVPPVSAPEPDRLVGTVTTPIRGPKDLLMDAEFSLYSNDDANTTSARLIEPSFINLKALINGATCRNIFPPDNTQPNNWKLYQITLGAENAILWLVHPNPRTALDAFSYARLILSDVMIMQMQCNLTTQHSPGRVQTEHYTCSTHPSTHTGDPNSFRVEYHSSGLSTPTPPTDGAKTVYSHSAITYEDSYQ